MKKLSWNLVLSSLIFTTVVSAQGSVSVDLADPEAAMMMNEQSQLKRDLTPEKKLEKMQSFFIQELFLNHVFSSEMSLLTDEEKADSMVPYGDFEFQNQMMVQAYSDMLAKQDILQMKKLLRQGGLNERYP